MDAERKVRENRLRRRAERQGLRLERSRRRDPQAAGYGTYRLVDVAMNAVVAYGSQDGYGLDLDEVEKYLDHAGMPAGEFSRDPAARQWMDEHCPRWRDTAAAIAALGAGLADEEYVGGVLFAGITHRGAEGQPAEQVRVIADRLVRWATRSGAREWAWRYRTTGELARAISDVIRASGLVSGAAR